MTSKNTIRDLVNCLLTKDSKISPHTPSSIAESSGLEVPYHHPLREEAKNIPLEGEPSLKDAQQLAKGFLGYDKCAPTAGKEALQDLDSYIKSAPDNSYNPGVQTP
ncbi:Uncharacterised protein [Legionella steigerwaltii]|uniref:Uncharacterized protein n=1 Tax=Legionella steigerwaltii TaxID=460 RepID=A0A378LBB1_9GAMM|nr:hypothetical protein [Legionella steigerwaltii]KTD70280.1 hypothetical protein Lstg_3282 [Legionella steigerwaltii]STY24014.1 Uncharacterised protein [Legionella steigerwaltii]